MAAPGGGGNATDIDCVGGTYRDHGRRGDGDGLDGCASDGDTSDGPCCDLAVPQ